GRVQQGPGPTAVARRQCPGAASPRRRRQIILRKFMDVARPDIARRKKRRRLLYSLGAVVALAAVTLGLSQLKPAAPTVEMSSIWTNTVRRGMMTNQVRGNGTLVPEQI